jgi:radical SAM protein with 4Fe4S-binding SPASM domain
VAELLRELRAAGLCPPRVLTLSLTDHCNLSCRHCWVDAQPRTQPIWAPVEAVARLIEEFAALGGEGIRLTGGEPLLHSHWHEFMSLARDLGLSRIELQTNGLLLGEAEIAALLPCDGPELSLRISLDGACAESHDRVRGAGSFTGAMAAIRRLAAAGLAPRIVLAFTEMAHNLEEFPALLTLAAELGIGSVISGTLVRGGRGAAGGGVIPPAAEQFLALLERYRQDVRFRDNYAALGTMAPLEWWLNDCSAPPCSSLGENPYITPLGLLYPCLLLQHRDYAVSGLFQRSLAEAYRAGLERWSTLRQWAQGRAEALVDCRQCAQKAVCAGGCIGRSCGSGGDLHSVDDRCRLRRLIGEQPRFG